MKIKVLGLRCENCDKLEMLAREVLAELGVEARVEHIADHRVIRSYGVTDHPALVIDGEVRAAGRVPAKSEVVRWVATALGREGNRSPELLQP